MNLATQEQIDRWEEQFARFFLRHTKKGLNSEAIKRGILLFPINKIDTLLRDKQLEREIFGAK